MNEKKPAWTSQNMMPSETLLWEKCEDATANDHSRLDLFVYVLELTLLKNINFHRIVVQCLNIWRRANRYLFPHTGDAPKWVQLTSCGICLFTVIHIPTWVESAPFHTHTYGWWIKKVIKMIQSTGHEISPFTHRRWMKATESSEFPHRRDESDRISARPSNWIISYASRLPH